MQHYAKQQQKYPLIVNTEETDMQNFLLSAGEQVTNKKQYNINLFLPTSGGRGLKRKCELCMF